jgi:hypothetical protein
VDVLAGALWEVLCDVSSEVTAYLDRSQGEGEDDEEEEEEHNTPPMPAPQLFNLLFDRFDVTPKNPSVEDEPTVPPAKGKEKVPNDEDDEATVEL